MNALLEPLTRYDWGGNRGELLPIDNAIRDAQRDSAKLSELELALLTVLQSDAKLPAKEYICRKLALIGTAQSVPALVAMLPDADLLDRALLALQAIPDGAARDALLEALNGATGTTQLGIVNALGERRDPKATAALTKLAENADTTLAGAAKTALRKIGTAA